MCEKTSSKTSLLKRDVCQHLAALKAGKRHSFYVLLIQIIVFIIQAGRLQVLGRILAKSWQTHPQAKCWQTDPLPPKSGGLYMI